VAAQPCNWSGLLCIRSPTKRCHNIC